MLKEGEDFYYENGLMVFTETYHQKRGYCCGSLCRHCPFPKEVQQEAVKRRSQRSILDFFKGPEKDREP